MIAKNWGGGLPTPVTTALSRQEAHIDQMHSSRSFPRFRGGFVLMSTQLDSTFLNSNFIFDQGSLMEHEKICQS